MLAAIFGCPVIFVAAARTGKKSYRIYVEPLAEKVLRTPVQLSALITLYARRLEALCVAHPLQWFNFYNFWK